MIGKVARCGTRWNRGLWRGITQNARSSKFPINTNQLQFPRGRDGATPLSKGKVNERKPPEKVKTPPAKSRAPPSPPQKAKSRAPPTPPVPPRIINRIPQCKTQMDLVALCTSLSTTPIDSNTLPTLKALLHASQDPFCIQPFIATLLLTFLTTHQLPLSQDPTFSTTGGIFFTKMLRILLHSKDFPKATHLLHLLLRNSIKVDFEFFSYYLRYCSVHDHHDEAIQLHHTLQEKLPAVLEQSSTVVHVLGEMYAKMGRLEEAEGVWERVKVKDKENWNYMVMGYLKGRCLEKAEKLIRERKGEGMVNGSTWNLLIKIKFSQGKFQEALKLVKEMERSGVKADVSCWNIVIPGLFKNNQFQLGKEYFEQMRDSLAKQNTMTWNLLFQSYFDHEVYYLIDRLINEMKENKIATNKYTWTILITEYLDRQHVDKAIHYFEMSKKFGNVPDLILWNMLLKGLLKNEEFDKALYYFEEMKRSEIKPTVSTWSLFIKAYLHANQTEMALDFFSKMQSQGITSDSSLWNAILSHLFDSGKKDLALKYMQSMKDYGYLLDYSNWHVIIQGHFKFDIEQAIQLFEDLPTRGFVIDVSTWNMVIEELVKLGKWEMALNYTQKMELNGLKPNPETQNIITSHIS